MSYSYEPRTALRRVVLSAHVDRETGRTGYGHAELHVDGSTFVAMHTGWSVGRNLLDDDPESLQFSDENLVGMFTRLVASPPITPSRMLVLLVTPLFMRRCSYRRELRRASLTTGACSPGHTARS